MQTVVNKCYDKKFPHTKEPLLLYPRLLDGQSRELSRHCTASAAGSCHTQACCNTILHILHSFCPTLNHLIPPTRHACQHTLSKPDLLLTVLTVSENKQNSCIAIVRISFSLKSFRASKLLQDPSPLPVSNWTSSIFSIHCPAATYVIPYQHILYTGPIYNILNTSTSHSGYIWPMDGFRLSTVQRGLRRGFRAP